LPAHGLRTLCFLRASTFRGSPSPSTFRGSPAPSTFKGSPAPSTCTQLGICVPYQRTEVQALRLNFRAQAQPLQEVQRLQTAEVVHTRGAWHLQPRLSLLRELLPVLLLLLLRRLRVSARRSSRLAFRPLLQQWQEDAHVGCRRTRGLTHRLSIAAALQGDARGFKGRRAKELHSCDGFEHLHRGRGRSVACFPVYLFGPGCSRSGERSMCVLEGALRGLPCGQAPARQPASAPVFAQTAAWKLGSTWDLASCMCQPTSRQWRLGSASYKDPGVGRGVQSGALGHHVPVKTSALQCGLPRAPSALCLNNPVPQRHASFPGGGAGVGERSTRCVLARVCLTRSVRPPHTFAAGTLGPRSQPRTACSATHARQWCNEASIEGYAGQREQGQSI